MSLLTDVEAIPVHLASSDVQLAPAPARPKRRRRALRTNTYTLTSQNPTQPVLPQADTRVEAWITSAVASPTPATPGNSAGNDGSATNPAANTTIDVSPGLTGTYTVSVTVFVSGGAAADSNNMQLVAGGTTIQLAYPGASATPVTQTFTFTLTGQTIAVKSIGAASGATAVYNVQIVWTPVTGAATPPPVIFMSTSQAGAQAQGGGAAQINGTDTMPFPVATTDQVWLSAASGFPVTVSVAAIYEEDE